MNKYDTNKSGKLESDQIVKLLTDLDETTAPGTEPSEEELQFILKVADQAGDDCLSRSELTYAIKSWYIYVKKREKMQDQLKLFDKSGTGSLNKAELKQYLISLNEGKDVSDQEVDWVFSEADVFGNGQIASTELLMATSAWYANVEKKKSSFCSIS